MFVRIQLEWLELTANLFLAGYTRREIQTALNDFLLDKLSVGSESKSSGRSKAISILSKIWVTILAKLAPLRDEALEFLQNTPKEQHLPIHWGMTMAVYPFFGIVAEHTGRLLRLQGSFAAGSIQRRLQEKLGERETVSRATQRVLRCFVDWGVLQDTSEIGVYQPGLTQLIDNRKLAAWLVEAALVASDFDSQALSVISQTPALFPFVINSINPRDFEANQRLEFFHQGLDERMVMLHGV
ncbi:hypothetical protein DSM106972_098650 [Dulcicalothrix desertica PCC 7102]|uniref:Uncharacterized protein n=1 Tax=Dulcicalothrix desertica PCC 7102 TaxID=232991 RepID=A0A3S1A387_9CYAN|nr:hypothetical protein [Dulcicalothrix desertica]RUS92610.1 hypothetical protein DSM106972_098650 [Dulcicalothrix desertica PCC 7102]TWH53339.1 hypothetical protein CAL7102_01286 [Dulcicalothrix desertica PCC 7102]